MYCRKVFAGQAPISKLVVIGTGDGIEDTFDNGGDPLVDLVIFPGSVTVVADTVTGTDNGSGIISGAGITSGVINYITGTISIVFDAAVTNLVEVTVTYTQLARSEAAYNTAQTAKGQSSVELDGSGVVLVLVSEDNTNWYVRYYSSNVGGGIHDLNRLNSKYVDVRTTAKIAALVSSYY